MNVLVIEDDVFFNRLLCSHLLNEGYTVTSAQNGHQAIDLIENNLAIDVVVCDIFMPGTSGPTFALMLNRYYKKDLPLIIVMSAISNGEEFLKNLNIPFNYFISKPFQIDDLFLILQQHQHKKLTTKL